jgi:hypothetical protein
MTPAEFLAEQLAGTREWTLKLIADLKGDDWTFQPRRGWGTRCGYAGT